MSDNRVFRITNNKVEELKGTSVALERSLQTLIEKNLEAMLGVRFLASEYSTGDTHAGRIDTLGIDENGLPVIIEYKRSSNENVLTQGLYYLDWLMDHKADFELLVLKKLGEIEAEKIDFRGPRLLCIAGDFIKFDMHAVKQMDRNIELIRYKRFGTDLLLLESMYVAEARSMATPLASTKKGSKQKTFTQYLADLDPKTKDLYEHVKAFLTGMGDDVQVTVLEQYEAFKRLKNFAAVVVYPHNKYVRIWVKADRKDIQEVKDMVRDVTGIGHAWNTGNVELTIRDVFDLKAVERYVIQSYEQS